MGQEKGVLFLRGCISLKNRSYCPLLGASTSPFKSTCLLIRLTAFKLLSHIWERKKGSFFKGEFLPQKWDYSFQAMLPYMGAKKGSFFYGAGSPLKIGLIAPY
jgi:hypothetical protein